MRQTLVFMWNSAIREKVLISVFRYFPAGIKKKKKKIV